MRKLGFLVSHNALTLHSSTIGCYTNIYASSKQTACKFQNNSPKNHTDHSQLEIEKPDHKYSDLKNNNKKCPLRG